MDAHRKKRLQQLIETRFEGDRAKFQAEAFVSKGRVSQLLDPDEPFGEVAARRLAEKLNLPARYFDIGRDIGSPRRIPVISEVQAGKFKEIVNDFARGGGATYLHTDLDASPYAFALQIEGRSMLPDFKTGDRVIIDPDVRPTSGDFVAARNAKNEATFKKYRVRGVDANGREIFELIPLNTDEFNTVRSDMEPLEIIGTMIEHRTYRRNRRE